EVFRPKLPALRTPSVDTMLRTTADPYAAVGGERTHAAYSWSNFSHNVAGLVLLAMSLLAVAASRPGLRWAGHCALASWATPPAKAADLQHRLAGVLAITLGLVEWRARRDDRPTGRLGYVFPV